MVIGPTYKKRTSSTSFSRKNERIEAPYTSRNSQIVSSCRMEWGYKTFDPLTFGGVCGRMLELRGRKPTSNYIAALKLFVW